MSRLIDFTKVEAAGNDFILIDSRKINKNSFSKRQIQKMCDRHLGIGADGLIFLSIHPDETIGMDYYNADGSAGNMCANGLRAIVLFANILGNVRIDKPLQIRASDGTHQAFMFSEKKIKVELLTHGSIKKIESDKLDIPQNMEAMGFINTGVPHLVIKVNTGFDNINVINLGSRLRYHLMFGQEGTNINFLQILEKNKLQVRTYERGVENETLSCGTGVTACALLYWDKINPRCGTLQIDTRGGELKVSREGKRLFLEGPAHAVYAGHYFMPNE